MTCLFIGRWILKLVLLAYCYNKNFLSGWLFETVGFTPDFGEKFIKYLDSWFIFYCVVYSQIALRTISPPNFTRIDPHSPLSATLKQNLNPTVMSLTQTGKICLIEKLGEAIN